MVLRLGGFTQGMDKAERATDRSTKRIKSQFSSLKGAIAGAFAGIGIAGAINAIVRNTQEAENALNQLQARIKSTGGAAGVSAPELQAFASELQGLTTFGDDAILQMQSLLLSFTSIRGDTVKGATRAILDLSTALGQDLQSSAQVVGKALNSPVEGLSALGRIGIKFTEDQKELIKALVETGDVAGAQGVILRELETRFGGAAEAASNTFGGALKQVQNAFGDLLEAPGSGLTDVTASLKEFSALLRDPGTISAAQALTSALISGFTGVANAITGTVNVTRFLAEELAATFNGAAADDIVRMEKELESFLKLREAGVKSLLTEGTFFDRLRFFGKDGLVEWYSDADLEKNIKDLKAKLDAAYKNQPSPLAAAAGVSGATTGTPSLPPKSVLQEIKITLPKIEMTEMEKFYADLDQSTRTQEESALSSFYEQKVALDELWRAGVIGAETYNARLLEIKDELVPEFEVTVKKVKDVVEKQVVELNEFQKQAARNTQDIIADTLTSGFDGGIKGIVKSFGDMLIELSAQAVAANIASKIFGEAGGGTKGSSGLLGTAMSLFAGYFGGAKDAGGPISAGVPYLVGERGPEVIVPRGNGTVIPNGGGMRPIQVNQSFPITSDQPPSRRTLEQYSAAAASGLARANRRGN